jgi:tetratricopeptide (TPR) repeat protein
VSRRLPGAARAALTALAVAAATGLGCATVSGPPIERTSTGEIIVRLRSATSFDDIAESVYGDADLGPSIARLTHRPYEEHVPGGTVLVLPIREVLEQRVTVATDSDRSFELGLAAADAGSYRTAAEHFREALGRSPGRLDVRYNLGLALMHAGELTEATEILESIAKARPDDPDSRYAFGSLLRKRNAHKRALGEFEAACRLDPRHAKAAFARARTLEDLGRSDQAAEAWARFLADFPKDPLAESARRSLSELRGAEAPRS